MDGDGDGDGGEATEDGHLEAKSKNNVEATGIIWKLWQGKNKEKIEQKR